MCVVTKSSSYFPRSVLRTANTDQRMRHGRLQEVNSNGKLLTVSPEKLSWSLQRGRRVHEVPTVKL